MIEHYRSWEIVLPRAFPSELASLACNWSALPDHIRQAIATLVDA